MRRFLDYFLLSMLNPELISECCSLIVLSIKSLLEFFSEDSLLDELFLELSIGTSS